MESFGGVLFPGGLHTQESLKLAMGFPFQETDVLIVSYPKSGESPDAVLKRETLPKSLSLKILW